MTIKTRGYLRRYSVSVKAELRGQEGVPEEDRRYGTFFFREGFVNREEAVSFARQASDSVPEIGKRKVRAVLYTCDVTEVEDISIEELSDVGQESRKKVV